MIGALSYDLYFIF